MVYCVKCSVGVPWRHSTGIFLRWLPDAFVGMKPQRDLTQFLFWGVNWLEVAYILSLYSRGMRFNLRCLISFSWNRCMFGEWKPTEALWFAESRAFRICRPLRRMEFWRKSVNSRWGQYLYTAAGHRWADGGHWRTSIGPVQDWYPKLSEQSQHWQICGYAHSKEQQIYE